MNYQKFDFQHKRFKTHCEAKQAYILEHGHLEVSENEFVAAIRAMPKHLHWSRGHSPSDAKKEYNNLKTKFGLFMGIAR